MPLPGRGLGTGRFVSRGLGPRLKKNLYAIIRSSREAVLSASQSIRTMFATSSRSGRVGVSTSESMAGGLPAKDLVGVTAAEKQAFGSDESDLSASSSEGTLVGGTENESLTTESSEQDLDRQTKRIEEPVEDG